MSRKPHKVMVSSTFLELREHRQAVFEALIGEGLLPVAMEFDASLPELDLIDASLAKVGEADAYVGLISYRYGKAHYDAVRNPDRLSLTELEFDEAAKRGIPKCMFLMHKDHPTTAAAVGAEHGTKGKLAAFLRKARKSGICAEFISVSDLKAKAIQSFARLRELLDTTPPEPTAKPVVAKRASDLPLPPALCARPEFIPRQHFFGRERELTLLREWAQAGEPVLVFEAIGGMGKSMLTWQWVQKHARAECDWAGILWYSFYERGADMNDFCVTALAYMTGRPMQDFRGRKTADLTPELLLHLRARSWLVVLDGLERVLVAYHRLDAAQVEDDDVAADPDKAGRRPEQSIRPADDELLRQLCAVSPAKILVSSRLMPLALLNEVGQPMPGVQRVRLHGLAPEDAERMLRAIGVHGNSVRMRAYLERQFGCHPLVTVVVAGLALNYPPAPSDLDRWADDPDGGADVNLAKLDLKQRRNHILSAAFADLDPDARELLGRLALISDAVAFEVLEALNPRRPEPPKVVKEPKAFSEDEHSYLSHLQTMLAKAKAAKERKALEARVQSEYEAKKQAYSTYRQEFEKWRRSDGLRAGRQWLRDAIIDLERRGLLQWDRRAGNFDLHPVVRGFAVGALSAEAKGQSGQKVVDYFSSRSDLPYDKAESLRDLANGIQVVQALNLAGKPAKAFGVFEGGLHRALYRLESHYDTLALLRPLFPDGWAQPPAGIEGPDYAATEASNALFALGRMREAMAQSEFSVREDVKRGLSANLSVSLRNLSFGARALGERAKAEHVLDLARDVAAAIGNANQAAWCDLFRIIYLDDRGELAEATTLWDEVSSRARLEGFDNKMRAQAIYCRACLLQREGKLTEAYLESSIREAEELRERMHVRRLWRIRGEWLQFLGDHWAALDAFEHAIAMERQAGLSEPRTEAKRAASLARLGRREDALVAAERAESEGSPHAPLADLYLYLGNHAKAKENALLGYRLYWAEGPPYACHWDLQTCRKVLEGLGEPEPQLPPFDPSKVEPLDFELNIRRLVRRKKQI